MAISWSIEKYINGEKKQIHELEKKINKIKIYSQVYQLKLETAKKLKDLYLEIKEIETKDFKEFYEKKGEKNGKK